jgi:hypothetical protein
MKMKGMIGESWLKVWVNAVTLIRSKDNGKVIGDQRCEAASDDVLLGCFPGKESNLLGIFAQPSKRKKKNGPPCVAAQNRDGSADVLSQDFS